MNICLKSWITSMRILQGLGFSPKTYSAFSKLQEGDLRRKGHLLKNPTDEQIEAIYRSIIKKTRIEQWGILNNTHIYLVDEENPWPKRGETVIDKIVIGSTMNASWDAKKMYEFDTSKSNDVTPGRPLPGISYHLFINASGLVEKVSEYDNLLSHTPGINARSIGVVMQYSIKNNDAAPTKKILGSLERLLTVLCLEFKLNPYKAIVGQFEVKKRWMKFLKGHRSCSESPGHLVPLDALRETVAVNIKKKLKYAGFINGPIKDSKFTKTVSEALNRFQSDAVKLLYNDFQVESIYDYRRNDSDDD